MFKVMNAAPDSALEAPSGGDFVGSFQNRLVRQFKVQVADWLDTCRALSAWEDFHLIESRLPERLSEHSEMLDQLERLGEWLALALGQPGFRDPRVSELIQLALQDLRDTRAMWHGRVTETRKKDILRDCFNES